MKRVLLALALVPALLTIHGCVVVIGTDTEDGVYFAGENNEEGGVRHDGDSLSREVARAIAADAELVAEDIRVSSEDGTVLLKGRVRGVDMLQRAVATAGSVEGATRVVSRMAVEAG